MDVTTLQAKQQEAANAFNAKKVDRDTKQAEVEQLEGELRNLQGEWNAYEKLIQEIKTTVNDNKPDPANVIEAKEATNGRK